MKELIIDSEIVLKIRSSEHAQKTFNLIDSNRAYLRQWLPWVDSNTSVKQSEEYIEQNIKAVEEKKGANYGIFYNNELVGMIGFHEFDYANKKTSLGYWLSESHQGKGIMSRCVEFLTNYAFNELNLHRVEIQCAEKNSASRAIPEKLGFTQEGILKDNEWLYDHFVDCVVYGKISEK